MKKIFLKFPNESTANSVLFTREFMTDDDGTTNEYLKPKYQNISTVGYIYSDECLKEEGMPPILAVAGWHVNLMLMEDEDITPLEDFIVIPKNPVRDWF